MVQISLAVMLIDSFHHLYHQLFTMELHFADIPPWSLQLANQNMGMRNVQKLPL